ncbi:ADP-ribosylglycohydrolase family protein [Streptomyces sp. IBSBF 2953]|uniref:ADP-ribosylglycohydrolase family protein n=1 Tax=Streptomyces TaxID=1883 RepID=UPI002119BFE1|nr:ADP-ribosylglycohydrolase family protein [Streptomyces scabiei]MCQ9181443.1 ADP-ribosylglycohydrolase family protein [Streptomyces hayashii]MDX3114152.1 ADP-ribosylglycohydrolase family protein [Streptomyces scabiei]
MGATAGPVWGRAEQQDFRSRVRGTLLGAAVGDALGAPVDGLDIEEIRQGHGPEGVVDLAPAYGRRGAVSHLTQLTLFTMDGLIRAQVRRDTGAWHPPTDLHRAYLRWAATQRDWGPDLRRKDNGWLALEEWLYVRRDPTRTLLLGLGDETMGTLESPKSPDAAGPEVVPRSVPFGLLVGWEPQLVAQLAVECAAQTHGHPTAGLSAGAYAVTVHALARGESLDGAVQRALALLSARPGHEPVSEALRHALGAVRQGLPGPARVEELAAAGTAEAVLSGAVYCALVAEDVRHGLRLAVNHGAPSASTAAVAGGLLGAMHGETALPPAWLAELEGRPTMLELADDFAMEMTQGPALHNPAGASPGWLTRYPRET